MRQISSSAANFILFVQLHDDGETSHAPTVLYVNMSRTGFPLVEEGRLRPAPHAAFEKLNRIKTHRFCSSLSNNSNGDGVRFHFGLSYPRAFLQV